MTRAATLVVAVVLAACGATATRPRRPIPPDITEFLLTSAAADIHAHTPASGIRDVHIGYYTTSEGAQRYLLCGELHGTAGWLAFATTKTSGYEQVLGEFATTLCRRPTITWGTDGDLSASLQSRLDAPR